MTGQDTRELAAIIRRLSRPLDPQPTGVEPRLPKLDGIKVVVFDVYGTLIISGSGDISLTSGASHGDAAIDAWKSITSGEPGASATGGVQGCPPVADAHGSPSSGDALVAALRQAIQEEHAASPHEFPEVEIRDIWRSLDGSLSDTQIARLAVEYECRVNPVWPMPGCGETLAALRDVGLPLGIVSNAQFFTPIAMEELLGDSLAGLGFEQSLCVWSYAHRQAKPGTFLYEQSAAALAERSIAPQQVLYVGNDMRNDVWPASRVGFRTALFAGDARSLRLREDDQQVAGVEPDAVLTDLRQILTVLPLADG
ncbi:MAG: HAD family hydrolase [Planctomycetota bacterium]